MRNNYMRPGAFAVLAVAGLTLAVLPGAASAELASATHYGGGIDLRPSVSYSQAFLTVSRGEMVERRVFGAGEMPTLGVFDAKGAVLADGVYTWELELVPDKSTARALRRAATENGGVAPNAWKPMSGSFAVRGGAIVGPGETEAGEEPRRGTRSAARATASGGGGGRGSQGDDDAAVGMSEGFEAAMAARTPAAPTAAGALPMASYRSDAAVASGQSAELIRAPATRQTRLVTQPKSDGTNGRDKAE